MKILHVTPHLDGDVGKAHAAIAAVLPDVVQQSFVLLAPQRDPHPIDRLRAAGARVLAGGSDNRIAALAEAADIVQFEFWNDPRLIDLLARCDFPAMRSMVWTHSPDPAPATILRGLMRQAGRFAFTREAAMIAAASGMELAAGRPISVVDGRFAATETPQLGTARGKAPAIAYLGPTDLGGMHPGFFDVVDRLAGEDIRVSVWGVADAALQARARAMRHPERIQFRGEIADRAAALAEAQVLFCPFAADPGIVAEIVLADAMASGLVPVVLGDGADKGLVRDSETGFLARSIDECVSVLDMLLLLPELREKMSQAAARCVAETRKPEQAAQELMILWLGLLGEERRHCDFRSVLADRAAAEFAPVRRPRAGAIA